MRVEEGFHPVGPKLLIVKHRLSFNNILQAPFVEGNPYTTDPALPGLLRRILPSEVFHDVDADLTRFGGDVITSKHSSRPSERVADIDHYILFSFT